MPIFTKKSDGTWSTNAKKVFVKASDGLWKSATRLFAKTANGWVQMWPGDAPAVNSSDPINIRSGGYNGTVVPSPQYINAVLYGHDGNGSSVTGATPITITNRKMKISEDDTGNTTRYTLETSDIYDLTNNSEANIGYKRYMADGWYLFYQLDATNIWGTSTLYSYPPIKIIRRTPIVSSTPTLTEDYTSVYPLFTFDFTISDLWYQAADWSRSYVRWWRNTSKTPGGDILQTTYLNAISFPTQTRSGSYSDYNGTGTTFNGFDTYTDISGGAAGTYVIAELVLINSYTDHVGSVVSSYKSTGAAPVISSMSILDDNNNTITDNSYQPDQFGTTNSPSYTFSENRLISDGYINVTATVNYATANTAYVLWPRIYNNQTGVYYTWNSTTTTTGWPDQLSPNSVTFNGETATVKWRFYINANTLYGIGGPTYEGGKARWSLALRASVAPTSTGTKKYFEGVADLGSGEGTYFLGSVGGEREIAPSTAYTLNSSASTVSPGTSVTFSGTATSYPSGYASYPRAFKIEWGDGTGDTGWQYFAENTSNPSTGGFSHTYNTSSVARIYTIPQGDLNSSNTAKAITVQNNLTAPSIIAVGVSNVGGPVTAYFTGGSGPYYQIYWTTINPLPVQSYTPDGSGSSSPVTDPDGPTSTNTNYMFVRSVASLGETSVGPSNLASSWSSGYAFNMTAPNATAPTSVSASTNSSSSISVNWSGSSNATKYRVWYSTSPSGNGVDPASSYFVETTGTSATFNGLSSSTTYYFWVSASAANNVWTSYSSSPIGQATTSGVAPATPTGLSATTNRTTDVFLSWNASAGATTYEIWYGAPPQDYYTPDFYPGSATYYFDNGISQGSSRTYYIRARNAAGASAWSSGVVGTRINDVVIPATAPGTPGTPTNGWTSGTTYPFSWSAPSAGTFSGGSPASISYYNLYVYQASNSAGSGSTLINTYTVYGTSFTYTSPNVSLYYACAVSATNTAGLTGGISSVSAYK